MFRGAPLATAASTGMPPAAGTTRPLCPGPFRDIDVPDGVVIGGVTQHIPSACGRKSQGSANSARLQAARVPNRASDKITLKRRRGVLDGALEKGASRPVSGY